MLAHLLTLWLRIRNSLWPLPLAIAAACGGIALLALNLDLSSTAEVSWLYGGGAGQAAAFAASLVSAMITLTALAFSITMIVLTLAAQQLGPRLIQLFLSDRGTQSALGLFIGTVIYLLLVLRTLGGESGGGAPNLAITLGSSLVLACILTLLFFMHSLARSVVADRVIARVGDMLDKAIIDAFPVHGADDDAATPAPNARPVSLERRGYVQRIDYRALANVAQKYDARVFLAYHAGAHVIAGETDAWISGGGDCLARALRKMVVISVERTEGQDPEWSARQLVEIALRALSPGINDEFTALAVIDRLTRALALLIPRHDGITTWRDNAGAARVFGPAPTFDLMLDAAFDQIRESGAEKLSVMERLAENLLKLARIGDPRRAKSLERHFRKLKRASERSSQSGADRSTVQSRIGQGLAELDRPALSAPAPVAGCGAEITNN